MGFSSSVKIMFLKLKLKNGNIHAAYELSHMYLSDETLPDHEETGIEYLTCAANGNVTDAQCELAQYYLDGKYVPQNTEMAMHWLLMAADKGSESAWNRLKKLTADMDPVIVLHWCEKYVVKNSRHAYIMLGSLNCSGIEGTVPVNYNIASEAYIRAIDNGAKADELPLDNLVSMASHFYNMEKNYEMAVYWCTIAAKSGSPLSKYILGRCYFDGTGVKQDYSQAFIYFKGSAENGILESKVYLGKCYMQGFGVASKNPAAALELFNEVSSSYPEVFNYMGKYYIENNDAANGALNYEKAEAAGAAAETDGEFYSLALYFDGIQDYEKAVHWLNLSLRKNTSDGYFLLAQYYFYGRYFKKDQDKAIEMLQQLSGSGYQPALLKLYDIYDSGLEGIGQDKAKAFGILSRLADLDNAAAIKMIGDAYMQKDSSFINQDYLQAAIWYDRWYGHSHKEGSINSGYLEEIGQYYLGIKDYKSAYKWFLRAYEVGSKTAFYTLGKLYFEGNGVKRDLKKAFICFRDSAKEGISESKVYLGQYYMHGFNIIPKNPELALQLFAEVSSSYPEVYNYIGKYYLENHDAANGALNYEKADAAGAAAEKDGEFYELALYFDGVQNYERAAHWLNLSSKKNTAGGYFLLAQYYLYGRYFQKDGTKAVEMLELLSDKKYKPALLKLYSIYDNGEEGIGQNKAKAFNILSKLADMDDAEAVKMMGDAYMQKDNSFMHQDYLQAARWYDRWYGHPYKEGSVDAGHLEEIGRYFLRTKDYLSARKWFLRAVEGGAKTGYANLGVIADIYEKDDKKAFQYFLEAAKADVPEGMGYLARCYFNGKGTSVDYQLGYKYFALAADKENLIGLLGQAFCLINKIGVESTKEDADKIFMLLSKAVEKGNRSACELLSNCYELGIGTEVSLDKAIFYLCQNHADENLMQMLQDKNYAGAYEYVRDKKEYFYHKMVLTYFGKGTQKDKDEACEMFVDYYRTDTLNDICDNYQTRPAFKYKIAKDVIDAGISFERDKKYEKAVEYYKTALRFNPKAGILLARILFESGQSDSLPLLQIMSQWEEKDKTYGKCRSIASYMLGLYYEYFYSRVTSPQTAYTKGYKCQTTDVQDEDLMMQYYMKSSEDEAYKRIC